MSTASTDSTFDYIIIGAGTAGCLMANRLSADPSKRVLLIEAGRQDDYHWIHIPVGYLYCIGNPRTDWLYQTEADAGLNGRKLRYPRGKTLGGCSSINGMIYMRGQQRDYQRWAEITGDDDWSWDRLLPYFKLHEDHYKGASGWHGAQGVPAELLSGGSADDPWREVLRQRQAGGEWRVEKQRLRWDVLDAFAQAAQQAGIPATPDFNTGDNEGVGYFEVNQKAGWRWNASKAFLRPAQQRANLTVWTDTLTERLVIERSVSVNTAAAGGNDEMAVRLSRLSLADEHAVALGHAGQLVFPDPRSRDHAQLRGVVDRRAVRPQPRARDRREPAGVSRLDARAVHRRRRMGDGAEHHRHGNPRGWRPPDDQALCGRRGIPEQNDPVLQGLRL